jgi:hypothetical protein
MSRYSYSMFMYLHRASWNFSATLTEVSPCFFLSCKANARVNKTRKDWTRPALFQTFCVVLCIVCFVSFSVLFVCKSVLYYCHRVATQLQLTNISYHLHEHPLSCYCCRRYKFAAKSIFVQHSILSYCWYWRVVQQYTQNALLNFHGNNSQPNTPPCYVILKCLFYHYYLFFLHNLIFGIFWLVIKKHAVKGSVLIRKVSDSRSGPYSRHRDWGY